MLLAVRLADFPLCPLGDSLLHHLSKQEALPGSYLSVVIENPFLTLLRKTVVYPMTCSYVSFSGTLPLADGLSKVFKITKHPAVPELSWVMHTRLLHCEYLEMLVGILSRFPLHRGAAVKHSQPHPWMRSHPSPICWHMERIANSFIDISIQGATVITKRYPGIQFSCKFTSVIETLDLQLCNVLP